MVNHPNRSKKHHPAKRPEPETIAAARRANGMTQLDAAALVYATESAWRAWEAGDRPMHAGLWELFKVKTLDREVLRALGLEPKPKPLAAFRTGSERANRSIADEDDCAPD